MRLDVIENGRGQQIARAARLGEVSADGARGNVERRGAVGDDVSPRPLAQHVGGAGALAPLRGERGLHSARGERMPGTLRDEDVREVEQIAPALPGAQVSEGVRPEKQHDRALRAEFASQPLQRLDGIARRGLADFRVVQLEQRVLFDREPHHFQTVRRRCERRNAVPGLARGHPAHELQAQDLRRLLREAQVPEVHRVEGAAHDADGRAHLRFVAAGKFNVAVVQVLYAYCRIWPLPNTTYFCEVRPSRPTGPRACSLSVEMPISAPRPYSKPSAKRVEAFTRTELESTSRRKRFARVSSSVTIASVCCEPYFEMCSMAASRSFTTRTARMGARNSVYQSCSVADFMSETSARDFSSPRSSTPLSV